MNNELSAKRATLENMLAIFRIALPEIDKEAEIAFVASNPWGGPDKRVELKKYNIPGGGASRLEFTIAYLPEAKRVLALRIPPEDLIARYKGSQVPEEFIERLKKDEYYILQYIPSSEV